jgi:poly(A) polymerase
MSGLPQTARIELPPGPPVHEGAVEVVRRLQAAGHTAFWAGGCVRDLLLGRVPKDYDVATDAVPDRVMALFDRAVTVGKAFGVVLVPMGDHWYDVATFRQDHAYADGRHPTAVSFSDPATDAQRRDFTINALFLDPVRGVVIDYVNGRDDLERRLVRTVGLAADRFREDHLRMLRAVRFAATLDFAMDPDTAAAIRATASRMAGVSAERIRDELSRIWTEAARAGEALRMLDETGLLEVVLPEVSAMKGVEQPPEFHPEGDVFTHTVLMLNTLHTSDVQLAWAALLHDVGKPPTAKLVDGRHRFERHATVGADMARDILGRLRFPNDAMDAITFMIGNHMRFVKTHEMRRATLRRLVGAPTFPAELELHRVDCASSHGDLENYRHLQGFLEQMRAEPVLPDPWVNGHDVIDLGIPAGPEVGYWRKKAYDAQLEGIVQSREELLVWLRDQMEKEGQRE